MSEWRMLSVLDAAARPVAISEVMCCSITNLITETKHTKVYRGRRKLTLDFFVVKSVSLTQKDRAINEARHF